MGTLSRQRAIAVLLLPCLVACTSSYEPRKGPRLSVVLDVGSPMYVKDGRRHPHGLLGGGLVEAVEDDPVALEVAQEYHQRNFLGFVTAIAGLVAMVVGPSIALQRCLEADDCNDNKGTTIGVTLGGAALAYVGVFIGMSAQPYAYDAINIYNDRVTLAEPVAATPTEP